MATLRSHSNLLSIRPACTLCTGCLRCSDILIAPVLINETSFWLEQVEECVDCILDEADLQASLKIPLLKTRRDVWQELCRQRRLQRGSEKAASASDLNQPLSAWLGCMRLGQYYARFEARGLHTTWQVRSDSVHKGAHCTVAALNISWL